MTPELEKDILNSTKIAKNAQDKTYALHLYSAIARHRLKKRSLNPFAKKSTSDYSKRLAAAIVSILRNESFQEWYYTLPVEHVSKEVSKDLKSVGWLIDS